SVCGSRNNATGMHWPMGISRRRTAYSHLGTPVIGCRSIEGKPVVRAPLINDIRLGGVVSELCWLRIVLLPRFNVLHLVLAQFVAQLLKMVRGQQNVDHIIL